MDEVAGILEALGHEPVLWNDPTTFPLGSYTLPRLREVTHEVDAALFIFRDDDMTWYRGQAVGKPRDNVLLEYGLFAGALTEQRAVVCLFGSPSLASDLAGLTTLNFKKGRDAKLRLAQWCSNLGSITASTAVQGRWIKIGPHGYHFSVEFHADGTLTERALFGGWEGRGSWRIDGGILRMAVGEYRLSIFPSPDGVRYRGSEQVVGRPDIEPYAFTIVHAPFIR